MNFLPKLFTRKAVQDDANSTAVAAPASSSPVAAAQPAQPVAPEVSSHALELPIATVEDAIRGKRVASRLAEGQSYIGDVQGDKGLQVLGSLKGRVNISGPAGVVWVSKGGVVQGDIVAPQVYVYGHVQGTVRANLVIFGGDAKFEGHVFANHVLQREIGQISINATIVRREKTIASDASQQGVVIPISEAAAA